MMVCDDLRSVNSTWRSELVFTKLVRNGVSSEIISVSHFRPHGATAWFTIRPVRGRCCRCVVYNHPPSPTHPPLCKIPIDRLRRQCAGDFSRYLVSSPQSPHLFTVKTPARHITEKVPAVARTMVVPQLDRSEYVSIAFTTNDVVGLHAVGIESTLT